MTSSGVEGGVSDWDSHARWTWVFDRLRCDFRTSRPAKAALAALEDAGAAAADASAADGGGASTAAGGSAKAPLEFDVEESQVIVLDELAPDVPPEAEDAAAQEILPVEGVLDRIVSSLREDQQDHVLGAVFDFLTNRPSAQRPSRLALPRICAAGGGAKGMSGTRASEGKVRKGQLKITRQVRLQARSALRADGVVADLTEEQVREAIEAKLQASQRRRYKQLVNQYQAAASQGAIFPGKRTLSTTVLDKVCAEMERARPALLRRAVAATPPAKKRGASALEDDPRSSAKVLFGEVPWAVKRFLLVPM